MNMDKIVCDCYEVTVQDIADAIEAGAETLEDVQEATSAGTGCGGCIEELTDIVEELLNK